MKVSFSTISCPEATLSQIAAMGEQGGFAGVELRSFGVAGSTIASEPFLTDAAKLRRIMTNAGLSVTCIATGLAFDRAIDPALGRTFLDTEQAVRGAKHAIELAAQIECPLVRVFGFELLPTESRKNGITRILEQFNKALDACDRMGVKLVLENGGSFCTAEQLCEFMDAADNVLLGAAYSVAVGQQAGDDVQTAIRTLGKRLLTIKVRDLADGVQVRLGEGTVQNYQAIHAARSIGFAGPVVYELDRVWDPSGIERDQVQGWLNHASQTMHRWVSGAVREVPHAHAMA
ncbi:MAG: sugar phosphate isomerase/epimerase [Planctomycetes bacterium]|nr:sugar phosphate isomerase/epimerase [Planctomycetota bacterium]